MDIEDIDMLTAEIITILMDMVIFLMGQDMDMVNVIIKSIKLYFDKLKCENLLFKYFYCKLIYYAVQTEKNIFSMSHFIIALSFSNSNNNVVICCVRLYPNSSSSLCFYFLGLNLEKFAGTNVLF